MQESYANKCPMAVRVIWLILLGSYNAFVAGITCYRIINLSAPVYIPEEVTGCDTPENQAAYEVFNEDFNNNMSYCAGLSYGCTTIFAMDAECVSACISKTYGFSTDCSPAFGNLAKCGFDKCKTPCIDGNPNSTSCVTCNEEKCDAAFHSSSGFCINCAYVPTCNGDSDPQCPVE